MTNFEALKQMPMKSFANLVFRGVKSECNTLADFEEMLERDFPGDLEGALQQLHLEVSVNTEKATEQTEKLIGLLKSASSLAGELADTLKSLGLDIEEPHVFIPEDSNGKHFERERGCKAPSGNSCHSKGEKMENVDKTIEAICNWIQKQTGGVGTVNETAVANMVSALAELIKARALNN